MGKSSETSPPTPFETELAAFFGEAPAGGVPAPAADHVAFRPVGPEPVTPLEAAEDFARHAKAAAKARSERVKVRPHSSYSGAVTVRVAWQGERFHTIKVKPAADGALVASHGVEGGRYLTLMLHDWLAASDRFTDVRWLTGDDVKAPPWRGPATPV